VIVKVQVPISSSLPENEQLALIYNKDRSWEVMPPITDDIKRLMNGRAKVFFFVMLESNRLNFVREMPDQGW
jgi:hypothetical protein